jgi:hypothetical protein
MRIRGTLSIVLLAFALAACSGGDDGAAGEAIPGFSKAPNEGLGLSGINQAAHRDPEGARSAALASVDSDDPDLRFAAAYTLSLTGIDAGDVDALRGLLKEEDVRIRLLAAQTLAGACTFEIPGSGSTAEFDVSGRASANAFELRFAQTAIEPPGDWVGLQGAMTTVFAVERVSPVRGESRIAISTTDAGPFPVTGEARIAISCSGCASE